MSGKRRERSESERTCSATAPKRTMNVSGGRTSGGRRVRLDCGHVCWVSWLSARSGTRVNCPGSGEAGVRHEHVGSVVEVLS